MKSNKLIILIIIISLLTFNFNIISFAGDGKGSPAPSGDPPAADPQTPITRSQAEQRALSMINLKWNYSRAKNGTTTSNIIMQPLQFHGVTQDTFTGIPYNWGGFDSLDSKSDDAPWTSFLDAINKGAYAGNVNTDYNYGYIGGTAGIDCSGFIQASFNIKSSYKLSTTTMFDNYFKKISLSELKHMDILNKSAWHVMIFDRWGMLNGEYGAYTYESTPEYEYGGIQGTKRYFISLKDINTGYIPGRYVNIIETPANQIYSKISTGNFAKVINVTDFAYFRTNPWTSAGVVGKIPKGTVLYLEDYASWWFKVTYNGKTGWIWSGLLGPIQSGKYARIFETYKLNVRGSPSFSGTVLGQLTPKQFFEVLGYSSDGQWWKIKYGSLIGWASSYYLKYIF